MKLFQIIYTWVVCIYLLHAPSVTCENVKVCSYELENVCYSDNVTYVCVKQIPNEIPDGTEHVVLNCLTFDKHIVISKGTFNSENWSRVQSLQIVTTPSGQRPRRDLTIENGALTGLVGLQSLRIDESNLIITDGSFTGIPNVKGLLLYNGARTTQDMFMKSLKNSADITNLTTLVLSNMFTFRDGLQLDEEFIEIILSRPLKYLELSAMDIKHIDLVAFAKHCNTLKYIALNSSKLESVNKGSDMKPICDNLKIVDFRDVNLPLRATISFVLDQSLYSVHDTNVSVPFYSFANAEVLLLSALFPLQTVGVRLYDIKNVRIMPREGSTEYRLKEIHLTDNKFKYIDTELIWSGFVLRLINLSSNHIEFLNPKFTTGLNKTLTCFDLSNNNLNAMAKLNVTHFENLFSALYKLTHVSLANNRLTLIPVNMFVKNFLLEIIDLSRNSLRQIHFDLNTLNRLRLLDVSFNNIHVLDSASLVFLSSCICNVSFLSLSNNDLSCSSCDHYDFIDWVLTTACLRASETLSCKSAMDNIVVINEDAKIMINDLCDGPAKLILAVVLNVIYFLTFVIMYVLICRKEKQKSVEELRYIIREDKARHKHVLFILTGNDAIIKADEVKEKLEARFKDIFETDRCDLVKIRDEEHPGCSLIQEITTCITRAAVVLILYSRDDDLVSSGVMKLAYEMVILEQPVEVLLYDTIFDELEESVRTYFTSYQRNNMWIFRNNMSLIEQNTLWCRLASAIEKRLLDIADL